MGNLGTVIKGLNFALLAALGCGVLIQVLDGPHLDTGDDGLQGSAAPHEQLVAGDGRLGDSPPARLGQVVRHGPGPAMDNKHRLTHQCRHELFELFKQ